MMRLLKRYIREHIRQICLYIGFLGIFQVVFFLYNIRTDAVRYAFFLSVGWLLLYGGLAFLRYYRKCRMLQEDHTAIVTDLSRMPEPEMKQRRSIRGSYRIFMSKRWTWSPKDGFPARRWRIIMECGSIRLKPLLLPCV